MLFIFLYFILFFAELVDFIDSVIEKRDSIVEEMQRDGRLGVKFSTNGEPATPNFLLPCLVSFFQTSNY